MPPAMKAQIVSSGKEALRVLVSVVHEVVLDVLEGRVPELPAVIREVVGGRDGSP